MPFNRKSHEYYYGEIRPRFVLKTKFHPEEVREKLNTFIQSDNTVVGKEVYQQFYLDIPQHERHFWSPELRISFDKDEEDNKTLIRVLVGPQYNVWSMFVFFYVFLGVLSLFGGMYGLSQLSLGKSSLWVWCLPITSLLIISVYIIAKLGQQKGRDQTLHLVSVLYHSLGKDGASRIES